MPPVAASHHLTKPEEETAYKFVLPPQDTEAGRAVTEVGKAIGVTVTFTDFLVETQGYKFASAKYLEVRNGETTNVPPFADVPINVPPVDELHHFIKFPVDVALKLVEDPQPIVTGLALAELITG